MIRVAFYSAGDSWDDWAQRLAPHLPSIAFVDLMSDDAMQADIALVWAPPPGRLAALPHLSCLLYTSPSPRDGLLSRMPSSA